MADDDVLVDFEEVPDVSYDPRQHVSSLPLTDDHVISGEIFSLIRDGGGISSGQNSVPELIIAVFVVQFDTRRGKAYVFIIAYFTRYVLSGYDITNLSSTGMQWSLTDPINVTIIRIYVYRCA